MITIEKEIFSYPKEISIKEHIFEKFKEIKKNIIYINDLIIDQYIQLLFPNGFISAFDEMKDFFNNNFPYASP